MPDSEFTDNCGAANCPYWPNPSTCDGVDPVAPVDVGCLDDECGCSKLDQDPFPVRYSSGRVQSRPITLFALPAIGGLSLEASIQWGSQQAIIPAYRRNGDTQPTIHGLSERLSFVGERWMDNTGDRIVIGGTMNQPGVVVWQGFGRMVTFHQVGTSTIYASDAGQYQLEDRGAGSPRWVITATGSGPDPSLQWGFDEATFPGMNGQSYRVGRLVRRAIVAGPTDYTGYYALTIVRISSSDDRVVRVYDSFGRELRYSYTAYDAAGPLFYRLSNIAFAPSATAGATIVATFQYTNLGVGLGGTDDFGIYLDRVDIAGGYKRFIYSTESEDCGDCRGLLAQVISPATQLASTSPGADLTPGETVVEAHQYAATGTSDITGNVPPAVASSGPGQTFAYTYGVGTTTQYDLMLQGGTCGSCQSGYQCFPVADGGDGNCYVAATLTNDALMLNTGRSSSTGTATSQTFTGNGLPKRSTDDADSKTTYGYGTNGALRCLVRNDNDDEAFADPIHPDISDCAGPTGSQIVKATTSAGLSSTQVPSFSAGTNPGNIATFSRSTDFVQRRTTSTEDGYTQNINRTLGPSTRTRLTDYDSRWRVTRIDGPLVNTTAFDVTDMTYYDSTGDNNAGQLYQMKRYVGASSGATCPSCTVLTTTYQSYDAYGVPGRITQPGGDYMTFTSSDRLTWTIQQYSAAAVLQSTAYVTFYPDGNVKWYRDPDGFCMTYEYSNGGTYVGAPTVITRDDTCLNVPLDQNVGEVEVRTYVGNDPRRLASIMRKQDGVVQFTYGGFSYDAERRLSAATTLDSAQPFAFGFTDGIPASTTAPTAPSAGSWETTTDADAFGRPAHMWRWLTSSSKQTYTLQYQSTFSPRPTRLIRGKDAAQVSITDFVYDDFGELVESNVPEQGISTFEFDAAGNLVKERVGHGTALVRTAVRTYDSLGRLLYVDNDTEHPVNCTSAPTGTPIADAEYKYDNCTGDAPAGVTCVNALGRLTIDRAILACSSGQAIKRGRWYSYDDAGRVSQVSFATVTGTTIGAPASMGYQYTAAGRMLRQDSPLNTAYPTRYSYNGYHKRLDQVFTSVGFLDLPLAQNITYRSLGRMKGFDTPITIGGQTLKYSLTYRSDDAISNLSWKYGTTAFVDQGFTYTPAGLIKTRTESATMNGAIANSRYYTYDALLRMTCEAKGSGTTQPTQTDCNLKPSISPRMRAVLTYNDGTAATAPPDVRATARIQGNLYTTLLNEVSSYSGGSGKVLQVTRATNNHLILAYDVLNRRTSDKDDFDAVRSERTYTYLPNGQVGLIAGRYSDNTQYSIGVNYDTAGRPLTMMLKTGALGYIAATYELFWNDADQLVAAQLQFDTPVTKTIQWHYHYLGDQLVSATRTITPTGGSTTALRFWFLTDERGLIYSAIDATGLEYFRAKWDASGWRTVEVQTGGWQDMWVPFALPGQILLEQSSAYASGSGYTHTRPALALNGARVADPLLGGLLQPDAADRTPRLSPEGYQYARNSPTVWADPSGADSRAYWDATDPWSWAGSGDQNGLGPGQSFFFDSGCQDHGMEMATAIAAAIADIEDCVTGLCAGSVQGLVKRQWLFALSMGSYHCVSNGMHTLAGDVALGFIDGLGSRRALAYTETPPERHPGESQDLRPPGILGRETWVAPEAFSPNRCLKQVLAHEALHSAALTLPGSTFSMGERSGIGFSADTNMLPLIAPSFKDSSLQAWAGSLWASSGGFSSREEAFTHWATDQCVNCK